ncbi:LuxR C-terminal-related transcriptional regulator [Salegentibacter sp. JZCK2]|uniref:helix-turn-helix and ligand-binding sensor domain-containing protein n=1 Tax=Salegentibacter tibetensis TaxID=2873600 RepID=UPI001CCEAC5E|nr:LuxR C-terminal-related transcriptional regulator [Salegentibacter tibetensis]MBZ9728360.1 LuxR C-terminal-related transcriptional regulator [Salegentibacter tibetensis]
MQLSRSKILAVIFFVFQVYNLFSQQLTPPIHNYSSAEYRAASQNWDIDVDEEGIIYTANNQGLLRFDGQSWDLFPLPNGSIIRSVFVYKDKIFTGSYKEFGYWKEDITGKLFYTSLIPKLGKYAMQSEEFWEILAFNGDIYFRSFGAIYKYDHSTIKPIQNVVSNKMMVYKDKLLLAVRKDGLFSLNKNNELQKLPNQEILRGEVVVDMAIEGDDLFIGTREYLFKYDGELCVLYDDSKLQDELRRSELNHVMALNGGKLLFGTVKNGIINYDQNDRSYKIFNRNNGLQNNTVLGFVEKFGNIWLGLDNGIDRIELDSPIEFYTDDTGELGAVYDLAFHDDKMFLASNTGVYNFSDNRLEIIDGAEGHTWNLEILNDTLFVNHNTGTYQVFENKVKPVETSTGSFKISELPYNSSDYLISSYTGIRNFSRRSDSIYGLDSLNFPVKNIVFENENTLWAAHPYEGLYRAGFENNFKRTKFVEKIHIPDGGNSINTNVFKINNQLAIFNGDHWFKYNPFKDSLEIFEELTPFRKYKILLKDENTYWFSHTENNFLKFSDFDNNNIVVTPASLGNRLVKNHEKILKNGDSLYYVALNDGFARIDLAKFIKNLDNMYVSKPSVKGFSDLEGRYDLTGRPVVPYKSSRDLNIYTSLPVSGAMGLRYRIHGEDTLSGEVNNGLINLQNLNHGNYELQLLAIGPQAEVVEKTNFNFKIRPPWYLSHIMKLVYILIVLSLLVLVYWFNQLKLKKHQLLLEEKFEKEHQERLNNLEKERLKNQITLKRKELANTTMVAAKKNEMLMEIQNELNKDKSNFPNQFKMKHILNKINRAIKNKDEWQVFETNFNELHEDFFKDVLDSYPNLTNKDLKLCSYLKMNLTSKEIAPLMGISVRGVEVHRYRLRKKMDLNKKENLTNFLIKNF